MMPDFTAVWIATGILVALLFGLAAWRERREP